jgi:hypothetical protein
LPSNRDGKTEAAREKSVNAKSRATSTQAGERS